MKKLKVTNVSENYNVPGREPDYVHAPPYKSLDDYLDDLAIFENSFNVRPDKRAWFSEKLLTTIEKQNYEKAIKILRQSFKNIG